MTPDMTPGADAIENVMPHISHVFIALCFCQTTNRHLDNLVLTETILRPSLTMVLPVALHDSLMWLTIHIDANNTWSTWPNIIPSDKLTNAYISRKTPFNHLPDLPRKVKNAVSAY